MMLNDLYLVNGLDLLKIVNVNLSSFSSIEELRLKEPTKLLELIKDKNYKIPRDIKKLKNSLPFSTGDVWMSRHFFKNFEFTAPYLYIGKMNKDYDLWVNLYTEDSFGLTYQSYLYSFFPELKVYST
ncbi:MAG: hypothetical protein WC260_02385 [Candidatus Pacearchaeota archaeon]